MGKVNLSPWYHQWISWVNHQSNPLSLRRYGILFLLFFFGWQGLAWAYFQLHSHQGLLELGGTSHFLQSPIGTITTEEVRSFRQNLPTSLGFLHGFLSIIRLGPAIIFSIWSSLGITYFFGVRLLAPRINRTLFFLPILYIGVEIFQTLSTLWLLVSPQEGLAAGVTLFNLFQRISFWMGFACLIMVFIGWMLWRILEFILRHTA
jgi:hypothetical protein